jgi:hypothetical protein
MQIPQCVPPRAQCIIFPRPNAIPCAITERETKTSQPKQGTCKRLGIGDGQQTMEPTQITKTRVVNQNKGIVLYTLGRGLSFSSLVKTFA